MFKPISWPGYALAAITIPTTLGHIYLLSEPSAFAKQLNLTDESARVLCMNIYFPCVLILFLE